MDMLSENQINRATKFIKNRRKRATRVCVIDANPNWLDEWEKNFKALDITFLRSPAVAHSCFFDRNALLAFAISEGRENELLDSGCSEIKSLKGTSMPHNGSWKLPSTKLFLDFSRQYASSLRHDYLEGRVIDIKKTGKNSFFQVGVQNISTNDTTILSSKSVILATGAIGRTVIPKFLKDVSSPRIFKWQELDRVIPTLTKDLNFPSPKILVVGGGLTAVQTAHKLVQKGAKVVLCSRRLLVERHFDISVKWFDFREAQYHQSQFYHEPAENRLEALAVTRGGGTVPPIYMKTTRRLEKRGQLIRSIAEAHIIQKNDDESLLVRLSKQNGDKTCFEQSFDAIVLACGVKPDCLVSPLVQCIQKQWPVEIVGGLPNVGEDLRWTDNLYVVGGLASLSVGPDANNLMGISRAAETVSKNLDTKQWLRKEDSNVLKNPFDIFLDESDTESESSSGEEDDD
jgi:hypothetical protein